MKKEIFISSLARVRDYFCNSAHNSLKNHCDVTRSDAPQTATITNGTNISFENENICVYEEYNENKEDSL